MIKKYVVVALFGVILFSHAHAQTSGNQNSTAGKSAGKPNIPGNFAFEFGFNRPFEKDSLFSIGFWGSRTINLYYQYEIRLFKSKFSFHPGIGFSLERYKLKNLRNLSYTATGTEEEINLIQGDLTKLRKSMVVTNYLEIPLELRFTARPQDASRSFKVSIGGRFGYLMDSFSKIKYKEEGETKILKDKQRFNMNRFRYGASFKIGVGNFSVFSYYNATPLFEKGDGIQKSPMKNFTVGISLSGF